MAVSGVTEPAVCARRVFVNVQLPSHVRDRLARKRALLAADPYNLDAGVQLTSEAQVGSRPHRTSPCAC